MGRTAGCLSGSYRGRRPRIEETPAHGEPHHPPIKAALERPASRLRLKCAPVTGQKAAQWARSAGQSVVRIQGASAASDLPAPAARNLLLRGGQPAGWRSDHFSHQGGGGGASGLGGRGGGGFGLVAMRFSPVASTLPRRSRAATGTATSLYLLVDPAIATPPAPRSSWTPRGSPAA